MPTTSQGQSRRCRRCRRRIPRKAFTCPACGAVNPRPFDILLVLFALAAAAALMVWASFNWKTFYPEPERPRLGRRYDAHPAAGRVDARRVPARGPSST